MKNAFKLLLDRRFLLLAGLLLLLFGWLGSRGSVDFPVYYRSAQNFFFHHGPVYGPHSGLGWPMYYRYPPLFLFLFYPLLKLPLTWAAGLWGAGKAFVLFWIVRQLCYVWGARCQHLNGLAQASSWLRQHWRRLLIPLLISGTYILVELRYGNVQFYIFGLTAAGLFWMRRHPLRASIALGLAISLKVWPLFFVPFFWVRDARKQAAGALLAAAGLTLLPGVFWNWHGNLALLAEWGRQEWTTAVQVAKIWYPSQSLRGIMTRYLTAAAIPGYPRVAIAHWPAARVRAAWIALECLGYAAWLKLAIRPSVPAMGPDGESEERWQDILLAAVGWGWLALLAPFTHIEDLCILLWPACVAGELLQRRFAPGSSGRLIWAAALLAGIIPLIPGRMAQRWLQAAGADFLVVVLLTLALSSIAWRAQARAAAVRKNSMMTSIPR